MWCRIQVGVHTRIADLMGPPHHKVREDSDPQNGTQEGERKEFSGFLLDSFYLITLYLYGANNNNSFFQGTSIKTIWVCFYLVADIWDCEPKGKDDGQQEEVGGLFAWRVWPF